MAKEEKVVKREPEYTHKAYGIFKTDEQPEHMVAVVSYNPVTGEAKVEKRVNSGGGRDFAIEKFKLTIVEDGLFG